MKPLLALVRAVDAISDAAGWLARWSVMACCLVSAGNALVRYSLGVGTNAWLELQWYLFALVILFGASKTLRLNGHIRVDLIYGRLSPRGQVRLNLVCLVLFLMPVALIIMWMSWPFFTDAWHSGEVSSNAGGLIRWPVKLLLPLGFALLALQGLAEILRAIAMLSGTIPLHTRYERFMS